MLVVSSRSAGVLVESRGRKSKDVFKEYVHPCPIQKEHLRGIYCHQPKQSKIVHSKDPVQRNSLLHFIMVAGSSALA